MSSQRRELLDRFQRELDALERTAAMHHGYQRIDPYIVETEQPGYTYSFIIHDVQSELWHAHGNWKHGPVLALLHQHRAIRPADIILDIGGNIAFTTCWYALATGPRGWVHAFDPLPCNAVATRYSAELNGLHNVTAHQIGVGALDQWIAPFSRGTKPASRHSGHVAAAQAQPLSYYQSLRPDVLAVDVESAEYELSEADFSAFSRLRLCVLEFHPELMEARGLSARVCLENFIRHGFEVGKDLGDRMTMYDGSGTSIRHGHLYLRRSLPARKPLGSTLGVEAGAGGSVGGPAIGATQPIDSATTQVSALSRALHRLASPLQHTIHRVMAPVNAQVPLARRVQPSGSRQETAGLRAGHAERAALNAKIIAALPAIEGWCTEYKAVWLAGLIAGNRCSQVLEIGIYGGRSLIPMAFAVQEHAPEGKVYGVEAWNSDVAQETATDADSDAWWRNVEFEVVKAQFLRKLLDYELAGIVNILEMSSDEAFKCLTAIGPLEFDLIHVDGSHSEMQALRDVKSWTGLLPPGGILVLGDIARPSMQEAREYLRNNLSVVEEVFESESVAYGAYCRRT
jgi:FkbM family methyltransferase